MSELPYVLLVICVVSSVLGYAFPPWGRRRARAATGPKPEAGHLAGPVASKSPYRAAADVEPAEFDLRARLEGLRRNIERLEMRVAAISTEDARPGLLRCGSKCPRCGKRGVVVSRREAGECKVEPRAHYRAECYDGGISCGATWRERVPEKQA